MQNKLILGFLKKNSLAERVLYPHLPPFTPSFIAPPTPVSHSHLGTLTVLTEANLVRFNVLLRKKTLRGSTSLTERLTEPDLVLLRNIT